jgi:hypothetical protein
MTLKNNYHNTIDTFNKEKGERDYTQKNRKTKKKEKETIHRKTHAARRKNKLSKCII